MSTFLTVCFYENPAALGHVLGWEKEMGDRISARQVAQDVYSYAIQRSGNSLGEFLICLPIDKLGGPEFSAKDFEAGVRSGARAVCGTDSFSAVKFLIFGKIESVQAEKLLECMRIGWVF